MKITKKTTISEVLIENPQAGKKLFEAGLHCVGCPMASQESIEDGLKAHGFSDKEIDKLINDINSEKK